MKGTIREKIRSGKWSGVAGVAADGSGWRDASVMTMNRLNAKGINRCGACGVLYDMHMAGPDKCAACMGAT